MDPLISNDTFCYNRELALAIGIERALILQHLHTILLNSVETTELDGRKWHVGNLLAWQAELPFLTQGQIEKGLSDLSYAKLIRYRIERDPESNCYLHLYSIDYDHIRKRFKGEGTRKGEPRVQE